MTDSIKKKGKKGEGSQTTKFSERTGIGKTRRRNSIY
jgi:hypothetical protein